MATQSNRMLVHDYMRRHNEALRCVHLQLCVNYGLKSCKKIKNHTLQDLVASRDVEIRVGSRIQANMVIKYNNPDIFIVDEIRKKITIVEVGITGFENLHAFETKKKHKYDLLANHTASMYKYRHIYRRESQDDSG